MEEQGPLGVAAERRLPDRAEGAATTASGLAASPYGVHQVGVLLGYQRMAGNRAVASCLGVAPRPVQRQVLTKLVVEEFPGGIYQVWDVVIGGRTPSPFAGTMGAHSTAWVAHIDEIRRDLVNRELQDAAGALVALAAAHVAEGTEALKVTRSQVEQGQRVKITDAEVALAKARAECAGRIPVGAQLTPGGAVALQRAVQVLVDRLLTYLNYLPGATVRGGDPRGHGEGSARGDLNQFEYACALTLRQAGPATAITAGEPALLRGHLKDLGKGTLGTRIKSACRTSFDPAANQELVRDVSGLVWALFAIDTPDAFAAGSPGALPADVWVRMVGNFVATVRRAYPYAFWFTNMHLAANQVAGLRRAAVEAEMQLPLVFDSVIVPALADVAPATVRATGEFPAVAGSDIAGRAGAFQVTVLVDDAGIVGDVEMIGRTQSPHAGTMGAHTTAWVAHLDAVRRAVVGRPLALAWKSLSERATAALKDPTLVLAGSVEEKQQFYLVQAFDGLRNLVAVPPAAHAGPQALVAGLEDLICRYLTYLNFLPLSTIAAGYLPDGRAEGRHRTLLQRYEREGPAMFPTGVDGAKLLRKALRGLFDHKALRHFPPSRVVPDRPNWRSIGFTSAHPLYAQISTRRTDIAHGDLARTRNYQTLLEAYPRSMADSGLVARMDVQDLIGDPEDAIRRDEGAALGDMLVNNCLIHAVAASAGVPLGLDHLVAIRLRIGEIGNMLLATPRTIGIIRQVLGITRGVVVVYPDPLPAEEFGDTERNPVIVLHTGADHFVAYGSRMAPRPAAAPISPLKRPGDAAQSARTKARRDDPGGDPMH